MKNFIAISCILLLAVITVQGGKSSESIGSDESSETLPDELGQDGPPRRSRPRNWRAHHFHVIPECLEEAEISENELHSQHPWQTEEIPRKVACYLACKYEKLGFLKDGQVVGENFENFFGKNAPENPEFRENMRRNIEECNEKVKGTDEVCDKVSQLVGCLKEKHVRTPRWGGGPRHIMEKPQ